MNTPDRQSHRPLSGVAIGLSISAAEDVELNRHGLTSADVTDVTLDLCRRFVSLGARVVLGHQWRPGGVMEAVARFAQAYQPETSEPMIVNVLAYPHVAALSAHDRQRLARTVAIEEDRTPRDTAAALRQMRLRTTNLIDARICLCGKLQQGRSHFPGVVEEAVMALDQNRPLFVSSMMGGTASLLVQLIRGEMGAVDQSLKALDLGDDGWEWWHSSQFHSTRVQLAQLSTAGLAKRCGLTKDEMEELFDAQNIDTVLTLTSKGLVRLAPEMRDRRSRPDVSAQ